MDLNKIIYLLESLKGFSGTLPNGKVVDTYSWNYALSSAISLLVTEKRNDI